MTDTGSIIQLSTPRATSAIHIIRASGPGVLAFLKKHSGKKTIRPRETFLTDFKQGRSVIDQVLCFYHKTPASYTGEDMIEIHCHGSLLVADEILKAGIKDGLRPAERGEFTRRAVLNGRLSVEQAEAVDVLIGTRNDYLKRNALDILEARTSLKFADIRSQLIDMISDLETVIEFPEEDGLGLADRRKNYRGYLKRLNRLQSWFSGLLENYDKGHRLDMGISVAITGRPNSGKSTLMNALLREERVLVSNIKGTTRDYVREEINLEGFPLILCDTAGIRSTAKGLEKRGIARTLRQIQNADIVIMLANSKSCLKLLKGLPPGKAGQEILVYISHADILDPTILKSLQEIFKKADSPVLSPLCLLDKKAVMRIEKDLLKLIKKNFNPPASALSLLNERQKLVCQKLIKAFEEIRQKLKNSESEEIIANEFCLLNDLLKELDLDYHNEEVFDRIFSRFCIGK